MADSPPHLNMSQQDHPPSPTENPLSPPPSPPPSPPLPPPPSILPPPRSLPAEAMVQQSRDQSQHLQPSISSETLPSPKKVKKTAAGTSTSATRPAAGAGKHAVYRGIRSRSGKWVSEIREPKKTTRIWLGTYPSPEMAAAAYDVAALALKGGDTLLNFPDRASRYPTPDSPSPQDIRRAAAAAAAMMKPENGGDEAPPEAAEAAGGEPPPNAEALTGGNTTTTTGHDQFVDEEALFHMPNLLLSMAEGMLVSPPRMGSRPPDDSPENSDAESLWSYSFD
ncbi:hypothetical protein ABFS83_01G077500 [Erythranthe nasuta]